MYGIIKYLDKIGIKTLVLVHLQKYGNPERIFFNKIVKRSSNAKKVTGEF